MTPRKDGSDTAAVSVEIFGQSYTLRTDDDPSYVETLATFVDARMREMADRTRTADSVKIAILAALNVADELHRLQRGSDEASLEIEDRAGQIEAILDDALAAQA